MVSESEGGTMGDGHVSQAEAPEPARGAARPPARTRPPPVWQRTFSALRSPNYRLWFLGQLVSLVGTWMQGTAQGFLVFELTRSAAYLGYVGFASGVPSWLFMLFGGVVADRVARRTLLVITQSTMMVLAFILAGLTFAGWVQPWHIVLLALALGVANAFDAPARQAFVFELVDREDVTNAIALNSSLFNLGSVVGPAMAGLAYAALGPAGCFTLNGLSFLAVIAALLLMRFPGRRVVARTGSALAQLREGVRYLVGNPLLRLLILVPAVTALFGTAYGTLLPAWAVEVLGGDATTNGVLQSARGAGSLGGALMVAALGAGIRRGRLMTLGTFVYPLALLGFAVVRAVPLAWAALAGVGWGHLVLFNMANTLVQTHVPDAYRGRVMSVYSLAFFGVMPLAALWAGALAEIVGAPLTVTVSAGLSLLVALLFWLLTPQLRRLS